jgi:hypothetical protein
MTIIGAGAKTMIIGAQTCTPAAHTTAPEHAIVARVNAR